MAEKEKLGKMTVSRGSAPQLDVDVVKQYLQRLAVIFQGNLLTECKQLIRVCVEGISLDPEACTVRIKYKTPGHAAPALSHSLVAGAGFEPGGSRNFLLTKIFQSFI
jgi:hypothetical protein